MTEAVVVALITALGAVLAQYFLGRAANKDLLAQIDKQSEVSDQEIKGEIGVIKNEIKNLSDRVERHNNVVERTYALEQKTAVLDEKMKVANHRIDDLEGEGKDGN